ncbi:MAG: GGDEF domain-containing phosphodiesterase [Oscillospiraceae bacterium]|nr:GGDEF domain-containing phosphodiesterase [Oscillospiraceae bacterium]
MHYSKKIRQYSVFEINHILDSLREYYNIVRLVDAEECRVFEVMSDGSIHYLENCFSIWGRSNRCINCSSKRACMTQSTTTKAEHLERAREKIRSVPIYLELKDGTVETCVIECVCDGGEEDPDYVVTKPEEYINSYDFLTRLYSEEILLREIRNRLIDNPEERYLLVLSCIRNFSVLNRLFGTESGNRLMISLADMLRQQCTREEVYGRLREDSLLILIKKDRFREDFFTEQLNKASMLVESPIFTVQIKLGIYEIHSTDISVTTMIDRAELAAASIQDNPNTEIAWYTESMMARQIKDRRIMADFEEALENGEFQIFLQPQVHAGQIQGAEALVRWIRPDGMLPPNDFLPILRQSELLSVLDVYVWEKSIRLLSRWQHTEFDSLYISVNVDASDFYYVNVPEKLRELCLKYGVPTNRLHVELTESSLYEDSEQESRIVEQLHRYGFVVAIDDFGKGFSSLSLLKDIPADVLKIDMGFMQGERNPQRKEIILNSVIDLAGSLEMGVVSEGVEKREQVDMLVNIGCSCFQGYYYSRPVPVEDFELAVRENLRLHSPAECSPLP